MKITDRCTQQGEESLFISDYSPLKSPGAETYEPAVTDLKAADFICVAYNPGRAVRVDSAMLAYSIKKHSQSGQDVIFNLSPRDMNKLALQSHLLGAQLLGLDNVLVIQGDPFRQKDLARLSDVSDFKSSELMASIAEMNQGRDFKGLKLKAATDLCIGAAADLGRGIEQEAALTHRKVRAGAHYLLTQPVFSVEEVEQFLAAYRQAAGEELDIPVFWGVQILRPDGVIFSSVPIRVREELEAGRSGIELAAKTLEALESAGISRFYLVPPIMKGGARDYAAAGELLAGR